MNITIVAIVQLFCVIKYVKKIKNANNTYHNNIVMIQNI